MLRSHPSRFYRLGTGLACLLMAVMLASCVSTKNPNDPWENYNRAIFKFNEGVDKVVFKPVATVYNNVIPAPLSKGVSNFYANLRMPLTIVNNVLQANPKQAIANTWRFGLNSTFGLLGLMDIAADWGLHNDPQDFGLTLAKWGLWKNSAYLVAPFYGPTTLRDSFMMPLDLVFTPWPYIRPLNVNLALYALDVIDTRARLLKSDKLVEQVAMDEYAFVRDAYLQYRKNKINPQANLQVSEEELARAFEGDF